MQSIPDFLKQHENSTFTKPHPGFSTKSIHCSSQPDPLYGGYCSISMSSTFAQKSPGKPYGPYDYARCGNPSTKSLEKALAEVEYGKHALVFASGFAALTCATMLLKAEENLLYLDIAYCGTLRYLVGVGEHNKLFSTTPVDMSDLKKIEDAIKPNTKMLILETPTNPMLVLYDIEAICKLCKEKGIITVVENTMMSPYLQSPLLLGADISYTSASKCVGGHSDMIHGYLALNDDTMNEKLRFYSKSFGGVPGSFDCYLIERSLKTLKLRMKEQCKNAMLIARFLEKHEKIEKVIYPGLESHPQHELAKKQMRGFGCVITMYIKGGIKEAKTFLSSLKVMTLAESFGAIETLIESPAVMTHWYMEPEERKAQGIDDNLVRISVGLEDIEDLLEDLNNALTLI